MLDNTTSRISKNLNISEKQVVSTLNLFSEGATIPFIARYRQELTGGLDEVEIALIQKENTSIQEIEKRRAFILASIKGLGFLTDELNAKIVKTYSITALEDIYLPFKPKRKTKASVARENGLEKLAAIIMRQDMDDLELLVQPFIKGKINTIDEALEGARHVISEWVNERQHARKVVRRLFRRKAMISSKLIKGKEVVAGKFRDYYAFSSPLQHIPSHRLLAIRRAESEGFLRVAIFPPEDEALQELNRIFVKSQNLASDQVKLAVKDAYKRLLKPSIETEFKSESREKADDQAIRVFADNLRQLLLTPPLGQKRTLAIDPGFKSGCKTVCLDAQGQLLHNETIFPHPLQRETSQAGAKVWQLIESYNIEAIAIGNGTAGRETEDFIRKRVHFKRPVEVYMVNEAGASVYSASSIARKEFPDYDVTVRGAVSIGRRLLDPLAELVKIDPKSIGVGQYQHDVDQNKLRESLDQTVVSVVNEVGVEVNTASVYLLSYVSGLGDKLAENIVNYRNEHGVFRSREDLKKIKGMGSQTFEQSAGFLRIADAKNPLDNSAVHPESYGIVKKIGKDLNISLNDLVGGKIAIKAIDINKFISEKTGLPTLNNILESLGKIGRDPRGKAVTFRFDPNLHKVEDLKEGMIVPGIVTNIAAFGAFVDVGVKQDGLIHVSEMADRFVKDPSEIVNLNQKVNVKVLSVDIARKRVQLSLKI